MEQELRIACKGYTTVELDDMHDLQGTLKTLSEADYVKLRNSFVEFGFSFPEFFWEDSTGKKWTVDAHSRNKTLRKMREEGWTIPPLPADPIFAKDKVEAKKKLLILNSRYGKITDTGMADFLNEPDSSFLAEEVSDYLTFPELDFSLEVTSHTGAGQDEPDMLTCPSCGTTFAKPKQ